MHKEESAQNLVDEVLDMIITELLARVDDTVQVSFHEVSDDVDVSIASPSLRFEYVDQSNDIVVLKEL